MRKLGWDEIKWKYLKCIHAWIDIGIKILYYIYKWLKYILFCIGRLITISIITKILLSEIWDTVGTSKYSPAQVVSKHDGTAAPKILTHAKNWMEAKVSGKVGIKVFRGSQFYK